ncbi:MAG: ABC transporter ATP-binding protein [Candidatus Limnocylindrales bacterium]
MTGPLSDALPRTPASTVLSLERVVKTYPGEPPTVALAGVDLEVRLGEFVAVVGPSGSGKSTLLGIMGTLERPTDGRVVILGRPVAELADEELAGLRAAAIGFVFQQFHLLDGLTAWQNVALGLVYRGIPGPSRKASALRLLDVVGLGSRAEHRPHQLSGGERQRVAIARAVIGEPAVVLADEPTGSLDSASGAEVLDLLRRLHGAGSTIVVITHSEAVAAAAGRRIELLDGRVVA